ncbi:fibronectin type III domain-containing protein [Patulibacter defluvii]|uniref:fibronectin type III domain-containing protein n=1 Tax=Patulibacter defluvii TaxID=3095358 RepID=UPI002A74CF2F|nr:fibronectin type III domain-containing protein [Patulibacter sp. DM4]
MSRITPIAVAAAAIVAIAPATAQAATQPVATTGLAGSITPQSATLTGTIDPGGAGTRYVFEYGKTKKYGAKTATASAGGGTSKVAATAAVTGLQSNTVYHYRLVARNAKGVSRGVDRTFKTPRQPLGFAVAASPNPIAFGDPLVIAGTLGGTGSSNRQVQLQQNPWPYTTGFQPVGNVQLTSSTGAFTFPLLGVALNTQYRVVTTDKTPTISPVVQAGVLIDVDTGVRKTRVYRGSRLRFSGKVHPARDGVQVGLQRNDRGKWKTIKGGRTTAGGTTFSRYELRGTIRKGGSYRVFVKVADGSLQSHYGPEIKIRTRRR